MKSNCLHISHQNLIVVIFSINLPPERTVLGFIYSGKSFVSVKFSNGRLNVKKEKTSTIVDYGIPQYSIF